METVRAERGMVTAPHFLAAEAGCAVLRDGGNAIEAMVASAAAIAAVYPHMNAIGGDGFWLIHTPGAEPVAIDACGAAGAAVDIDFYTGQGLDAIPSRGPLAANTVAGTISGWQAALAISAQWYENLGGDAMPLARLLDPAIQFANTGTEPAASQRKLTEEKRAELEDVPGFAETFLPNNAPPATGKPFRQPRLAATFKALAEDGLEGFYRGELARRIARDLAAAGSPLTAKDLAAQRAAVVTPLSLRLAQGIAYNMTPPTQGLASLMILGIFERLGVTAAEGFDFVHGIVEASKQAFLVRDAHITDPAQMTVDPAAFLSAAELDARANAIDKTRALPWPQAGAPGDTIWMGAVDGQGRAVSFIQSLYWEFGSGVVLDDTGILWQNRGSSFRLDPGAINALVPGRKPFHTLNPALARLDDGRVMVYGTMGGEGQPQTQAAIFTRHILFGQDLQAAIDAPRWLLGRTWGAESTSLKLESRFDPGLVDALAAAGHAVELVEPFSDLMGHAGAIVHRPEGILEGASDPRSDGRAIGF